MLTKIYLTCERHQKNFFIKLVFLIVYCFSFYAKLINFHTENIVVDPYIPSYILQLDSSPNHQINSYL